MTLEERLKRLEDIEAIKTLQGTYGTYVDAGWNGKVMNFDKLGSVFTKDAFWKCAAMDIDVKGSNEIIKMLQGLEATGTYELSMHSFTNPVITIEENKASAKWLVWVGGKVKGKTNLVYQSEDVQYSLIDGKWLISGIDLHFADILKS